MPTLSLENITKRFQNVVVVDDLSLTVENGEFVCMLGPSGCGKTTTLRIIAGFESVSSGRVRIDGRDITDMPPQHRDIGFVFQQYALFPHLTVAENVGFGLRMRKRPRAEIDEAVRDALNLVRLKQMGERYPRQLSGGQQQRVALARALAIRPNLLLLDEPLSNLDAQLRDEMRDEIRRIQHDTGVTAIFVTHDQSEALALADRVAVMEGGRILQLDDPYSIYETPRSSFVGSFIGQSNVLRGKVTGLNDDIAEVMTETGLSVTGRSNGASLSGAAMVQVKKERVVLTRSPAEGQKNVFPATIADLTYLGHTVGYRCAVGNDSIEALVPNHPAFERFEKGDGVFVHWLLDDCRVFPG